MVSSIFRTDFYLRTLGLYIQCYHRPRHIESHRVSRKTTFHNLDEQWWTRNDSAEYSQFGVSPCVNNREGNGHVTRHAQIQQGYGMIEWRDHYDAARTMLTYAGSWTLKFMNQQTGKWPRRPPKCTATNVPAYCLFKWTNQCWIISAKMKFLP